MQTVPDVLRQRPRPRRRPWATAPPGAPRHARADDARRRTLSAMMMSEGATATSLAVLGEYRPSAVGRSVLDTIERRSVTAHGIAIILILILVATALLAIATST